MVAATAEADYLRLRPRLFGIAYRMLGDVAEAEDVVQEVWLRWQDYPHRTVDNVDAFLTTITTRLAINVARSARARRESYVGPWLPEPVDTSSDPALGAERAEALELAVLLVMERLTPPQRAAYILREAFDYPYDRIGEIIGRSPTNTRQLVSRARRTIADDHGRRVESGARRPLLDAVALAARTGDLESLEQLLAEDVVSYSDGGGRVTAAVHPVVGRFRVVRFLGAVGKYGWWRDAELVPVAVNGDTGVLISAGQAQALLTVTATPEGIDQLLWMMNPDRLSAARRRP